MTAEGVDMSESKTVQELNRELAEKLIVEGTNNPKSPYYGKFVGFANGQLVVVADDWDELARRLRKTEPDPSKTFAAEIGPITTSCTTSGSCVDAQGDVALSPRSPTRRGATPPGARPSVDQAPPSRRYRRGPFGRRLRVDPG
jgi:hypothetical protein